MAKLIVSNSEVIQICELNLRKIKSYLEIPIKHASDWDENIFEKVMNDYVSSFENLLIIAKIKPEGQMILSTSEASLLYPKSFGITNNWLDAKRKHKIIVNGEEREIENDCLSYEDVVSMIGGNQNSAYSVTFEKAEGPKYQGILYKGQGPVAVVKTGMVIGAYITDNA